LGSPADATSKVGSNNNAATASACTLRMIPSTFFGLNRPIGIEDTTARRWGNRLSQCGAWQFGLIEIRVAELAMICHSRFVAPRLLHRNSPHGVT
jgi:hypothetical protein